MFDSIKCLIQFSLNTVLNFPILFFLKLKKIQKMTENDKQKLLFFFIETDKSLRNTF